MTPLRGVRGDVGIAPYGRSIEVRCVNGRSIEVRCVNGRSIEVRCVNGRSIEARLGDGGGAKREGTKCAVLHGGFCFVRTFRGKTGSHNNCGKRCGNCAKPLAERVRGGCITLFFVGRW